jgi:hypothetical protein
MSYGVVIVLCALCALGGFVGGVLVYRNNRVRLEEEKAALLAKINALEETIKK